ncbi:hypothetical protein LJC47_06870 [Desulfosarcina sp. OttesenSCG-928-B08]|nr:hypothetical protein [Desulfosarcina sp. OttesenSCG-928-B08]
MLLLGAYEPTIWRIGWSPETEIVAVLVSGYHEQRVAGLTKQTPLMNSTHSNKGKCRYFYLPDGMGNMNAVSRSLFGREVDLAFLAEKGRVVVGKPLAADTKLITSSRISPESFYDRDAPMGQAGLDNAVKKGILRPATLEDVQA